MSLLLSSSDSRSSASDSDSDSAPLAIPISALPPTQGRSEGGGGGGGGGGGREDSSHPEWVLATVVSLTGAAFGCLLYAVVVLHSGFDLAAPFLGPLTTLPLAGIPYSRLRIRVGSSFAPPSAKMLVWWTLLSSLAGIGFGTIPWLLELYLLLQGLSWLVGGHALASNLPFGTVMRGVKGHSPWHGAFPAGVSLYMLVGFGVNAHVGGGARRVVLIAVLGVYTVGLCVYGWMASLWVAYVANAGKYRGLPYAGMIALLMADLLFLIVAYGIGSFSLVLYFVLLLKGLGSVAIVLSVDKDQPLGWF